MPKWVGDVGFITPVETSTGSGIYVPTQVVKRHYGNINTRYHTGWSSGASNLVGDVTVTNTIDFIGDPFALRNFGQIRWVEWLGKKWAVTDVTSEYPRITVKLGGLYEFPIYNTPSGTQNDSQVDDWNSVIQGGE